MSKIIDDSASSVDPAFLCCRVFEVTQCIYFSNIKNSADEALGCVQKSLVFGEKQTCVRIQLSHLVAATCVHLLSSLSLTCLISYMALHRSILQCFGKVERNENMYVKMYVELLAYTSCFIHGS